MRLADSWIDAFLAQERLPEAFRSLIRSVHAPLAERIAVAAQAKGSCLTVGLCGPQGSGKSTMTAVLKSLLERRGIAVAMLSLDDCYLSRDARLALSERVHPLLQTRGVPGTHDVSLGMQTLAALHAPGTVALPSFDKARDDVRPRGQWLEARGPAQVILFEGWCVGAMAQPPDELITPVNALEEAEDPNGIWRRYVNAALAGEYRHWFAEIDLLILLQAPSFEIVYQWRQEQERKLKEKLESQGDDMARVMSDRELLRFISHYERLTRHILAEMPLRADMVLKMDESRRVLHAALDRPGEPL